MRPIMIAALLVAFLPGCDRNGAELTPDPSARKTAASSKADDPTAEKTTSAKTHKRQPLAGASPPETVDDTPDDDPKEASKKPRDDPKDDSADGPPVEAKKKPNSVDSADAQKLEDGCAPVDASLKPMELRRFVFSSGLEGKDPKDKLRVAHPGMRVYSHLTMRNRSGRDRCLHLTFRVGKKKRTQVTLKIGDSWSWRTWAYNTIRADDRGPLELTIKDDQGALLLKQTLPVIAK